MGKPPSSRGKPPGRGGEGRLNSDELRAPVRISVEEVGLRLVVVMRALSRCREIQNGVLEAREDTVIQNITGTQLAEVVIIQLARAHQSLPFSKCVRGVTIPLKLLQLEPCCQPVHRVEREGKCVLP